MLLRIPAVSVLLCLAAAAAEPDAKQAKVDALFAAWNKPSSPGASLIVVKDGAVAYQHGYGSANLEYDIPITPSTVFHVASVSKQFTAMCVVLLAGQGKLAVDDDIRKYLPEMPDYGKRITIRNLLHHTSGIRDQWELLSMAGWRMDDVITTEHILKILRTQKELNFAPGDEHLYSNSGYTLLGEIVRRVSGKSLRQFADENIFQPLGMTHTHFHDDLQMIVKNRAVSYEPSPGGGFRISPLNYENVGATSLFTTVEDLAKWTNNFLDPKVGGKAAIEMMEQRAVLNNGKPVDYAFGLSLGENRGLRWIGHGGADAGYRTAVVIYPDQRLAVAILSNLASFGPMQLASKVAEIYLADQVKPVPDPPKTVSTNVLPGPNTLSTYAGRYLLNTGMIVDVWREGSRLMARPGAQEAVPLTAIAANQFRVMDFEVTFDRDEHGVMVMTVIHGPEKMTGRRADLPKVAAEDFPKYAGTFYSEELGTFYTMTVVDGKLVAQHRRHTDIPLSPIGPDLFGGNQFFFGAVRFTRDPTGAITGFRLTGGRVRNVIFRRVTL